MICPCESTDRSCDACVRRNVGHLLGGAWAGGHGWASRVAFARPALLAREWPARDDPKLETSARRQTAQLTHHGDPRYDELHVAFLVGARERWTELRAMNATERFNFRASMRRDLMAYQRVRAGERIATKRAGGTDPEAAALWRRRGGR